jgi:hypothetical protein
MSPMLKNKLQMPITNFHFSSNVLTCLDHLDPTNYASHGSTIARKDVMYLVGYSLVFHIHHWIFTC